jgi:predicted transcriptional regulator
MVDDAPSKTANNKSTEDDFLRMTAQLVAAYLRKNSLPAAQITEIINSVHGSLRSIDGKANAPQREALKPAVSVKKSVTPEYLICLEDGRKLKMLKRHLRSTYGLTPEAYRQKWGLPADYPMVAPKYAEQRSVFAKQIGLGKGAGGRKKAK